MLAVLGLLLAGCSSNSSDTSAAAADTTVAESESLESAVNETSATETTAPTESDSTDTTAAAPSSKATIFAYAIPEPVAIDPGRVGDAYGAELTVQVFDGLTDVAEDLSIMPAVASKWSSSADGKTWTFTLRPDSMFTNGRAVTAQDFVYAFARAADPDLASPTAYQGLPIAGWSAVLEGKPSGKIADTPVSGVKAIDDTTLEISTTEPFALLPKILIHPVFSPVPAELLGDDAKEKIFAEQPVGNGPYTFSETWQHNKQITLTRNEAFTGLGSGKVGRIEARVFASYETSYRDVQGGNLLASDIPFDQVAQARTEFGDRVIEAPLPLVSYVGLPGATAPFDNLDLRRAFSLAIDREALALVSNGGSAPLKTFASLSSPMVTSSCPDISFDPAKAKELYASSGGLPGDKVSFTYPAGGPDEAGTKAVANQLKENLGIDVTLKPMEFAPFLEALRSNKVDGLYGLGWLWDYPSAYNFLSPLYESTAADNAVQYKSAAFDELMGKIRTAKDEAAGAPFINEALDLLCRDMAAIPTVGSQRIIAVDKSVRSLTVDGLGFIALHRVEIAA
jgi:oligopeptide transport system substrate-binding protein